MHFYGAQKMSIDGFYRTSQVLAGARGTHNVQATLNKGFTSIREFGRYSVELSQTIKGCTLIGSYIYLAIGLISMTGGYSDAHNTLLRSKRYDSLWAPAPPLRRRGLMPQSSTPADPSCCTSHQGLREWGSHEHPRQSGKPTTFEC